MTKSQFISELSQQLKMQNVPSHAIKEIISEYDAHFFEGINLGNDEQAVALALGEPKSIAAEYKFMEMIKMTEKTPSFKNVTSTLYAGLRGGLVSIGLIPVIFYSEILILMALLVGLMLCVTPVFSLLSIFISNLPYSSFGGLPPLASKIIALVASPLFVLGGVKLLKWTVKKQKQFLSFLTSKIKNSFSKASKTEM